MKQIVTIIYLCSFLGGVSIKFHLLYRQNSIIIIHSMYNFYDLISYRQICGDKIPKIYIRFINLYQKHKNFVKDTDATEFL